jgi:uncharacterized protein involved in oxidation of intracellular sulfur
MKRMKISIVLNSNDPETAWNALRLGNAALDGGHDVSVFLMGAGVEIEQIDGSKFNVGEVLSKFAKSKGTSLPAGPASRSGSRKPECVRSLQCRNW